MQAVERQLREEAKDILNNRGLRNKDILEWSTGAIEPHDGEVTAYLPKMGVYVSVAVHQDKRGA